jgi:hypothetical protein
MVHRTLYSRTAVEYSLKKKCSKRMLDQHVVMQSHAQHLEICNTQEQALTRPMVRKMSEP